MESALGDEDVYDAVEGSEDVLQQLEAAVASAVAGSRTQTNLAAEMEMMARKAEDAAAATADASTTAAHTHTPSPPHTRSRSRLVASQIRNAGITTAAKLEALALATRGPVLLALSPDLPPAMARAAWSLSDYTMAKKLFSGPASLVYEAQCKQSGRAVALKMYNLANLSELSRHQAYREVCIHSRLPAHPNIIQLYAAFQESGMVVMVQEFAGGGDMYQHLYDANGSLPEKEALRQVIRPLLSVLHTLHHNYVIHRDIKLENILRTSSGVLKLADFGLAIDISEEAPVTRAGTLDYMAPEVLVCPPKLFPEENKHRTGLHYSPSADVWAVGVLAYELVMGCPPFPPPSEVNDAVSARSRLPRLPPTLTSSCRAFISSALSPHPGDRPTVPELLSAPWVAHGAHPTHAHRSAGDKIGALLGRAPRVADGAESRPESGDAGADGLGLERVSASAPSVTAAVSTAACAVPIASRQPGLGVCSAGSAGAGACDDLAVAVSRSRSSVNSVAEMASPLSSVSSAQPSGHWSPMPPPAQPSPSGSPMSAGGGMGSSHSASLGKRLATRFMSILSPSKGNSSASLPRAGKRHDGEWASESPTRAGNTSADFARSP